MIAVTPRPHIVDLVLARRLVSPKLARAIRLAAGVSQEAVAEELGVHRVSVARWESGERSPRGRVLLRYAGLLRRLQVAASG
jgi:transcriptional regulator with XRE-family HTH domain